MLRRGIVPDRFGAVMVLLAWRLSRRFACLRPWGRPHQRAQRVTPSRLPCASANMSNELQPQSPLDAITSYPFFDVGLLLAAMRRRIRPTMVACVCVCAIVPENTGRRRCELKCVFQKALPRSGVSLGFRRPPCLAPWCSLRPGLNRRVVVARWRPKLGATMSPSGTYFEWELGAPFHGVHDESLSESGLSGGFPPRQPRW